MGEKTPETETPTVEKDSGSRDRVDSVRSRYTTGRWITIGGSTLVAIGAILPWFTVDLIGTSMSVQGISRDGIVTLGLAVIAGVIGLVRWGRIARGGIVLLGAGITLLAAVYVADPYFFAQGTGLSQTERLVRNATNPGIGLYATVIGGGAIVAGIVHDTATE